MQESGPENIVVPYFVHRTLESFNRDIENAMRKIEHHSRIRFVKQSYNDNKNVLLIKSGNGCYFSPYDCLGKRPKYGQPTVSIGKECRSRSAMLHELLHAIGFPHEHQRPDREDYVKVYEENVEDDNVQKFDILSDDDFVWSVSDFDFDFASIMLYEDEKAFTENGGPTMERLDGRKLTDNSQLSRMDKEKLESL